MGRLPSGIRYFESSDEREGYFQPFTNIHRNRVMRILLLYSRVNNDIPYEQGYHELCGMCYCLFTQEMTANEVARDDPAFFYSFLFSRDEEAVAADTFWAYSRIVKFMAPFYQRNGDIGLTERCYNIHNVIIKERDEQLAATLEPAQTMYLWRCILCLFIGLIPIYELTMVWTWIFAFGANADIVVDIPVQVLLHYRFHALMCGYSNCQLCDQ